MASEDVLRHVQWPTFFMYYKLDIFSPFHRAHSEPLLDIMYENIGRNRVSTYFTRDQNRLLVYVRTKVRVKIHARFSLI